MSNTTVADQSDDCLSWNSDPDCFIPSSVLGILSGGNSSGQERLSGLIKRECRDFIVLEPVPDYRGRPDRLQNDFLTIGDGSDMPGLIRSDFDRSARHSTAVTMRKKGLTASGAIHMLSRFLSRRLRRTISPRDISISGNKDGKAITVQTIVIRNVHWTELDSIKEWPQENGVGVFLKDPREAECAMRKGIHGVNRFIIRVFTPGMSQQDLHAYLTPRITKLCQFGGLVPNLFGRQRLGRRQMNHVHGRVLVTGEYGLPGRPRFNCSAEAATYSFLCESANESRVVEELRYKLKGAWPNPRLLQQTFESELSLISRKMPWIGHGLSIEREVIESLLRSNGNHEFVWERCFESLSMMLSAWQSYWFNQALAHELQTMEQPDASLEIPLLTDSKAAREWYGERAHCQQAIAELDMASPFVRRVFLDPVTNRLSTSRRAPMRKAFLRVGNLNHRIADGMSEWIFDLPKGAFATIFLSNFYNLDQQEDMANYHRS